MKILITGGDGTIGKYINQILIPDYDVICVGRKTLDVTKYQQFCNYEHMGIKYVIHLAAMTDIEECQKLPDKAYYVNHTGAMNAAQFCLNNRIGLIYVGTTNIFDGNSKAAYTEKDTYNCPNPIHHYGRSKFYGESSILYLMPFNSWIIRAGWLFGGGYHWEKRFIKKVVNKMESGKKVSVVTDTFGSLTNIEHVGIMVKEVINNNITSGIYNIACEGVASRDEMVKIISETLRVPAKIKKVKQKDLKRPYVRRIENEIIEPSNIIKTGSWRVELKEYLRKEYAPYVRLND